MKKVIIAAVVAALLIWGIPALGQLMNELGSQAAGNILEALQIG